MTLSIALSPFAVQTGNHTTHEAVHTEIATPRDAAAAGSNKTRTRPASRLLFLEKNRHNFRP